MGCVPGGWSNRRAKYSIEVWPHSLFNVARTPFVSWEFLIMYMEHLSGGIASSLFLLVDGF